MATDVSVCYNCLTMYIRYLSRWSRPIYNVSLEETCSLPTTHPLLRCEFMLCNFDSFVWWRTDLGWYYEQRGWCNEVGDISKLEFYFLGLPQPQKAPESRQNPEKYESEKVRSPFWKGWDRIFTIFTRTTRAVTKKVPELRIINRICNRVNGSQLSSFPDLDKKAQKPQKGAETRKAFLELADGIDLWNV